MASTNAASTNRRIKRLRSTSTTKISSNEMSVFGLNGSRFVLSFIDNRFGLDLGLNHRVREGRNFTTMITPQGVILSVFRAGLAVARLIPVIMFAPYIDSALC